MKNPKVIDIGEYKQERKVSQLVQIAEGLVFLITPLGLMIYPVNQKGGHAA